MTFSRTGHRQSTEPRQAHNTAQPKAREAAHPSKELPLADMPPVRVALNMNWLHLGALTLDTDGDLAFPSAPTEPGLYRFRLLSGDNSRHYIGETIQVCRRFQHYRKPGPSQATNIRVNALLKELLEAGGNVEVDIVVDGVTLIICGEKVDADLSDKATRRLLENAALVAVGGADIDTLNR